MQILKDTENSGRKSMLSCIDVANYFLVLANSDGKKITLPKLVRLVCIAQGVSLALHDKPLFNEDIVIWP